MPKYLDCLPTLEELRAKALFLGVEARLSTIGGRHDVHPWCLEKIGNYRHGPIITARGQLWFRTEYAALDAYLTEQRINGYPDRLDT